MVSICLAAVETSVSRATNQRIVAETETFAAANTHLFFIDVLNANLLHLLEIQLGDHRRVVGRALALARFKVDGASLAFRNQRGREQDMVDAQTPAALR